MIKVFHNVLTESERTRLNGPDGGWDSEPRFSRYANVTCFGDAEHARPAWNHGDYTHVADVDTTDLEEAYKLTNHIMSDWQDNDGVEAVGDAKEGAKSSSMGDVLAIKTEAGYWELFVVASFGFESFGTVTHV